MNIAPVPSETAARAMGDLRLGLPVVLTKGGCGLAVLSAESANDARISSAIRQNGAVIAVTARRASTLKARIYDGDIARIVVPPDAAAAWARAVADPAADLSHPMKGPLRSLRDGTADLCRAAVLLARRARLLPAVLTWPVSGAEEFALATGLTCVDCDAAPLDGERGLQSAASAVLPLDGWPDARIHVFRMTDGSEDHCAVIFGDPPKDRPVLTRLHSACLTGDVLGSLKCDCGRQLRAAIESFRPDGGVLLYLNQEGRGIGLLNKVRAYGLQDQGYDTVEANHRLGFEDDERNFAVGARILHELGYGAVRLLTNNPAKVKLLRKCGISVEERLPLLTGCTGFNESYLRVKAEKSGHVL